VLSNLILKKLYWEDIGNRRLTKGKSASMQAYNIYLAASLTPAERHSVTSWDTANNVTDVCPIMVQSMARPAGYHPETGAECKKQKDNHNSQSRTPQRTILTLVCVVFQEDRKERHLVRDGFLFQYHQHHQRDIHPQSIPLKYKYSRS
jgi:hypothetical protein